MKTLLEALAKAALDISSYAGHDDDCASHRGFSCSCGYTERNQLVIDLAERVVEALK